MFHRFKTQKEEKVKLSVTSESQPFKEQISQTEPQIPKIDPHQTTQDLFYPVIENLLSHPLFVSSIIKGLSTNQELINQVVKTCFENFEAKYDIAPTQVYRDKIQESQDTLSAINQQVEVRSKEFDNFRNELSNFQQQTGQLFIEKLNEMTESMINKLK